VADSFLGMQDMDERFEGHGGGYHLQIRLGVKLTVNYHLLNNSRMCLDYLP